MSSRLQTKKYWESSFGLQNYGYDYAQRLILKDDFQKTSPFAWDIDYFDPQDQDSWFIASQAFIEARQGRSHFLFEEQKYQIYQSEKGNYAWISEDQILDRNTVANLDLVMTKLITNLQKKNQNFLILDLKPLLDQYQALLLKFLKLYLQDLALEFYQAYETPSHSYFCFTNEAQPIAKIMDRAISLLTLIPLFIKKLRWHKTNIWKDPNFLQIGYLFSIFIDYEKHQYQKIFEKTQYQQYLMPFNNSINLSAGAKEALQEGLYPEKFFQKNETMLTKGYYKFSLVKGEWNNYLLKIINEHQKSS